MSFNALLSQLLNDIPGAKGVIILDWEGEAVDQAALISEYDMKVIGAHSGIIVQRLKEMLHRTGSGIFEEIIFRYGSDKTVVASLSDDYFLLVQLGVDSVTATAVQRIRRCVDELRHDFVFD